MTAEPRARIGTSAWKKPLWRGIFYPPGLPQRAELAYVAERLKSLEINSTFHGMATPASASTWRAETPDDFVFSVKGSKLVTQAHRLSRPSTDLAQFFASGILHLLEKTGPFLWQTPEDLEFDPARVEGFLAALPHSVDDARELVAQHGAAGTDGTDGTANVLPGVPDRPLRHCFEARHPSFVDPRFIELLGRYDVAPLIGNGPGHPVIDATTSDFVYLRLYGGPEQYSDGYDDAAIDALAERIRGWLGGGRDVFAYFHNPDQKGTRTPFDAIRLQERVDALG
jgi:uncharacterized protein YecE (DUF72 family)